MIGAFRVLVTRNGTERSGLFRTVPCFSNARVCVCVCVCVWLCVLCVCVCVALTQPLYNNGVCCSEKVARERVAHTTDLKGFVQPEQQLILIIFILMQCSFRKMPSSFSKISSSSFVRSLHQCVLSQTPSCTAADP